MEILKNFLELFSDVWRKVSGVNISEIIIAVGMFVLFLFLEEYFQNL